MRGQGIILAALILAALLVTTTTMLYVEILPSSNTNIVESPENCVSEIVTSRSSWTARELALSVLSCNNGGTVEVTILHYNLSTGALIDNDTYVLNGENTIYYEYNYMYVIDDEIVIINIVFR